MSLSYTDSAESSQVEKALGWVRLGVPVFPCNNDKRPMTKHGFEDAVTDETQIKTWFSTICRFGLIGIACGERSGIIVVDVDCKVGRPNGYKRLAELGITPESISPYWETTPSGGRHYFCKFDPTIGNSNHLGIEIKTTGTYACVSPSGGYVWAGEPLSLDKLPPVPADLIKNKVAATDIVQNPNVIARPLTPAPAWVRVEDAGKGISTDWRDLAFSIERLALALRVIPNDENTSREVWLKVIFAIHEATGGSDEGLLLARLWSQKNPVHSTYWQRKEAPSKLRRARRSSLFDEWERLTKKGHKADTKLVTYRSIFKLAFAVNPFWDLEP